MTDTPMPTSWERPARSDPKMSFSASRRAGGFPARRVRRSRRARRSRVLLPPGPALVLACAVFLGAALAPRPCYGQFGGFNAEFAGGGARALSMGGAFIGLADDATASEFNPAGLWQLRRPEIAGQIIYSHRREEVSLFRQSGVTGMPEFATTEEDDFIPSFASLVYPTKHVVLGLSEFTNLSFERSWSEQVGLERRRVSSREEAANYALGLTAATGVTDRLSVGATLRYNFFRYEFEDDLAGSEDFRDEAFSANVGVLWRMTRHLHLGLVYKSPQKLEGTYAGVVDVDTELPATLGAGVAILPNDRLRLLVDVDHIWWSEFDPNTTDDFERDNVWRVHAGGEFLAGTWGKSSLYLRGGYLVEESNAIAYQGSNPLFARLADGGETLHHVSAGIGWARPRYQLDVGADVDEEGSFDLIASAVWYF